MIIPKTREDWRAWKQGFWWWKFQGFRFGEGNRQRQLCDQGRLQWEAQLPAPIKEWICPKRRAEFLGRLVDLLDDYPEWIFVADEGGEIFVRHMVSMIVGPTAEFDISLSQEDLAKRLRELQKNAEQSAGESVE